MEKRIGSILIIVEDKTRVDFVNTLLSEYSPLIKARLGLPFPEESINVITLIIQGNNNDLASFSGKLGRIPGITVKSAFAKNVNKSFN